MASPNKNPEYQAKLPKSGHNLGYNLAFTASTGMLLPVLTDFLLPGESVKGSINLFTQMKTPLAQPAQVEIEQIVDYFFVPINMLYQPFEQMKYQTPDAYSSNFLIEQGVDWSENKSTLFPVPQMDNLANYIYANRTHNKFDNDDVAETEGFESVFLQAYRLMDLFGYNPDCLLRNSAVTNAQLDTWTPNFFPYAALAYQCVYMYYYRLDQWEKFDNSDFNWDRYFGSSLLTTAQSEEMSRIFKLHYRPRYLDYFTNVKNSPLMSDVNVLRGFIPSEPENNSLNYLIDFKRYLSNANNLVVDNFGDNYKPFTSVSPTENPDGSSSIRNMFAAEKFLQITARAANRYDDQVLAHLGWKVPEDPKHNIKYLGTQRNKMNVTQVMSNANTSDGTDGSALGDRVGQMYGSISGKDGFSFTAPVHGVLIGIYSAVPKCHYAAGIDRSQVLTDIHDIWDAEFDHLGMQPVFGYETVRIGQNDSSFASNIIAWQWRYEQYKRKYSRVTSAFRRFPSLGSVDSEGNQIFYSNFLSCYFNVQAPYKYSMASDGQPSIVDVNPFLVKPYELDTMQIAYYNTEWKEVFDRNPASIYDSDPFIVDAQINYKKVSPMSVHSMPNLNSF